jgi:hypothetical protein
MKLKRFADRILRKAPSPLLPQSSVEEMPTKPTLPHCSKRIATQLLSRVPVSKRGELLVMQRMGFIDGWTPPSTAAKEVYDSPHIKRQCGSSSQIQWEMGRGGRGAAQANASDRQR